MSVRGHPCGYAPPVDAPTLRAQFPVLDRIAYLNAGTDGPLPAAATGPQPRSCSARRGRAAPVVTSSVVES